MLTLFPTHDAEASKYPYIGQWMPNNLDKTLIVVLFLSPKTGMLLIQNKPSTNIVGAICNNFAEQEFVPVQGAIMLKNV